MMHYLTWGSYVILCGVWTTLGVGANMAVYHVVIGDMSYWTVNKDVIHVTGVIRVLEGGVSLLLQLVNHKIININKRKTIITTKRWQSKFTNKSKISKRSQRSEHECTFACFHLSCIVFLQFSF
jgi:hypothetical protein